MQGIVHDLRNPLCCIVTALDLLVSDISPDMLSEEKAFLFKSIQSQAGNLVQMVSNILDYSKIANKKIELTMTKVDLENDITALILLNANKARAANTNI